MNETPFDLTKIAALFSRAVLRIASLSDRLPGQETGTCCSPEKPGINPENEVDLPSDQSVHVPMVDGTETRSLA